MKKAEFKQWLQDRFEGRGIGPEGYDMGDVWREFDSGHELEDIGVHVGWDRDEQDMYFRCEDGLLASGYEVGIEGETVWFFAEGQVENNMRDADERDLERAIERAQDALDELRSLR